MSNPKPIVDPEAANLRQLLKNLGRGWRKVAKALHDMNITGNIGRTDSCPVANYLRQKLPKLTHIRVGNNSISVNMCSITTPPVIQQFIRKFDKQYLKPGACPILPKLVDTSNKTV